MCTPEKNRRAILEQTPEEKKTPTLPKPRIDPSAFLLRGSVVAGDVTIEKNCSVWYNAVVRGDNRPILIGECSNVQDGCVFHTDPGFPLTVGKGVTVGHRAILHGCEIGDNTLIGMGAVVMDGVKIGKNCIVGAGALVTQNTVVPDNSLVLGSPARVKRALTPEEVEQNRRSALHYVEMAQENAALG